MSFVTRRSTLCSGSPCSALRGIVSPDAIVAGPWKRLAISIDVAVGQRRRRRDDDGVGRRAGGRQVQAVGAGLAVRRPRDRRR